MDSVKVNGDGRMLFTINEHYYEIKARRMIQTMDKFCALVSITNLSKDMQSDTTEYLDDSVRQIYALYERITLLNFKTDSIRPLYTDTREDLLSNRQGIKELVREYSERYIFPDDREQFACMFDPDKAAERLRECGCISFSEVFRSSIRHGQYAWKEYTLLKIDEENYFILVRNIHDTAKDFLSNNQTEQCEDGVYTSDQLWNNLVRSGLLRVFWKDTDRRFLGASQAFLDFYGFSSVDEIVGKNDEDLGWHVHPDLYMNDEYKVIHEGATFQNMPGNCISRGENRAILASKAPMYDVNGEITGLIGYFIDRESLYINDQRGEESSRRDLLTGLLNSRGIAEEAEAFQDEYYLRGTDFVRIHIEINDFTTLNEQYGFDYGDKVLSAFGHALNDGFGIRSAIGRYAGRNFTVLQQVESREEAHILRNKIKAIGSSVREIDGNPVTLYLSVGYALYSEFLSIEEQNKNAEMRLHADYDQCISAEDRIEHALEIFYMFDDLPVPYAVLRLTHAENSGRNDAVFFYVNHKYEEFFGHTAKELLGRTVRDVFPFLGDDWYEEVRSAALDGKIIESVFDSLTDGRHLHLTVRQIIYPGYCAVTMSELFDEDDR